MTSPSSGVWRFARAGALTVAVMGLSLTAHVVAGGSAPTVGVGSALTLVTFWASTFLTWRRLGRISLIATLVGSQVLLHQAFDVLGGRAPCVELAQSHSGHLTGGPMVACAAPMTDMAAGHAMPGAGMLVAHGVAAVLLGMILAGGEAALWFLAGLVWHTIPQPRAMPSRARHGRVVAARWTRPVGPLVPGGVGRRGPPQGRAAFS